MSQVLLDYFNAMDTHNFSTISQYLSPTIKVGFSDTSRNWNGIETAKEKFSNMFMQNPGFQIKNYTIINTTNENNKTLINVDISFITDKKEWNSKLYYEIENNKIIVIEHL